MVKETKLHKRNVFLLALVILLILGGVFKNQIEGILTILYGVTVDKAINLVSSQRESFNIALLGIGGGKHEGPDLTDTIILANVNIKQNKVHMFSIPRDLWIKDKKDKINSIYAKAQENKNGISAVKDALQDVTGQKVDYILVLDFEGFIKLVDHLGGINVSVEKSFSDPEYPIAGKEEDPCGKPEEELESLATLSSQLEAFPCRYKTIAFTKGETEMNGETALEFVRSRHGIGGEGSDFARSKRQQLVIQSLKEKAFSLGVILNPVKLVGVYNILKANINTNVDIDKVDDFIKLAKKFQSGEVKNYVIDEGNEFQNRFGLMRNPPITEEYRLKWVLIPRIGNGDYSEVHDYVDCHIQNRQCEVTSTGIDVIVTPTPPSE